LSVRDDILTRRGGGRDEERKKEKEKKRKKKKKETELLDTTLWICVCDLHSQAGSLRLFIQRLSN